MLILANILSAVTQILSYVFVALILFFVLSIICLIYMDIATMRRAKTEVENKAHLRLESIRSRLPFPPAKIYILKDENYIGKNKECDICFSDEELSEWHAYIYEKEGKFFLSNLDKKNKTMRNGKMVAKECSVELVDGDKIDVGSVTFAFVDNRANQEV